MTLVVADATSAAFTQADVDAVMAELQGLAARVSLSVVPPHSNLSAYVQLLTGLSPEWTGVYDDLKVEGYRALAATIPAEVEGQFLWRAVERMGKRYISAQGKLPADLTDLVYYQVQTPEDIRSLYLVPEETVKMLILAEPSVQPSREVRVNQFLASKGLLEWADGGDVDWQETLAYHVGHGQVWVNLLGREAQGIVSPGQEYAEVREVLVRVLSEQLLDSETGAPVVADLWRKEDIYNKDGRFFVQAPDLIAAFLPGYRPSPQSIQPVSEGGSHAYQPGGASLSPLQSYVLLAWGKSIHPGDSGDAKLIDLVTTALYILDLPISRTLSGAVIEGFFEGSLWSDRPPRYLADGGLTAEEEALLVDRLGALGYIE